MTGFCFGGGITWLSATQIPELKAAAPFYGPAPDLSLVPDIKAAMLGIYSSDPNDFANEGRDDIGCRARSGRDHLRNQGLSRHPARLP